MRIALYGLPCAGKTTLMSSLSGVRVLHGSEELQRISNGVFSKLSEKDKEQVRIHYTEYVKSIVDETIISDGHYSFLDDVVFTDADGDLYDVFLYLYCKPEVLLRRYQLSEKNIKYAALSETVISQWQYFEIESLRKECHMRGKDFYVISDNDKECCLEKFICSMESGYSSFRHAKEIVNQIRTIFPNPTMLYIVDGDKTIMKEDTYRYCCNGKTSIFDGDFYTGYQSWLFADVLEHIIIKTDAIDELELNEEIWEVMKDNNYVILSAGITELWSDISIRKNLNNVIASPYISADTKYFVVKELRALGYVIKAYGDSKIDVYMLKEADTGFLWIGDRISKSLKLEKLHGVKLIYNQDNYILSEQSDEKILADIATCKSNSGINGRKLAKAHFRLGNCIGKELKNRIPEQNTALLVLDRGGRFFGDGLYCGFGGHFYPYNPANDEIPVFNQEVVVIVDSVINTGKSIRELVSKLKERNPNIEIVIATNVIQKSAIDLFSDYLLFAVRVSDNCFIGKNQAVQKGNSGPDTADRLFNLIEKRF